MLRKASKGITPVVAIVLLLMMTVAVAGGAYAWMQGIIGGTQDEVDRGMNTKIRVPGLECTHHTYADMTVNTTHVDFLMQNSGETEVNRQGVDIFVYDGGSGDLVASGSISNADTFAPEDANWDGLVNASINQQMEIGQQYRVEFDFTNEPISPISQTCRLE